MAKLIAAAFSPATVGNVASGFDLIGHCIEGVGDRVTAVKAQKQGAQPIATIDQINGVVTELPTKSQDNTATVAATALLQSTRADFDVQLTIDKGIPLGSGLGGSAASATAAVIAVNALLPKPLPQAELYPFALKGESVASAQAVGDNVGPQLLGGLVLATPNELIALPVPQGLTAVVVHPSLRIDTKESRQCLTSPFDLRDITAQQNALAQLLVGLFKNNSAWIKQGLVDYLVEPRRKSMIPGFDEIQAVAKAHGALGGSISGAGPSVFAWFKSASDAQKAQQPMQAVFRQQGLQATVHITPVNASGAALIDPPH